MAAERLTPFAAIFGRTGLAEAHFPRIAAAVPAAAGGPPDRDTFLALAPVSDLLAEITPTAGAGSAQIALLAFHCFRRWQEGGPDRELEPAALRDLLSLPALGTWRLRPPASAGYVVLPRHQLWVAGAGGEPAEPVEGFFWAADAAAPERFEVLLVLGMHDGRAGVTVIELRSGPPPAAGHWGDLRARAEGADFDSVLPGGEHLLGLANVGEVLKLASRVFWHFRDGG